MSPKCNCGKEGKYWHPDGDVVSCNKHIVCPTYDELRELNTNHFRDLIHALRLVDDLTIYRESSQEYKDTMNKLNDFKKTYSFWF